MPKKPETMKELYAALKMSLKKSPEHQALIRSIEEVNRYTESLRRKDRFKRVPYVTAEQQEELMKRHKAVAAAAEAVLQDLVTSEKAKDTVRKLSALAARNYTNMAGYDPKSPKTLDTIEEDARSLKLDLRGGGELRNVNVGGTERKVVTFLNEKGKPVTGFFTPKTVYNAREQLKAAFQAAAANAGDSGTAMIEGFLDAAAKKYGPFEPGQDPEEAALEQVLSRCMTSRDDKLVVDPALLADVFSEVYSELNRSSAQVMNEIGPENLINLSEALETYHSARSNQVGEASIQEGARMDTRSAAVSAVADLLGCPNVVTRARPMVVVDENGSEIEGTFVMETKGCRLDNVPEDQNLSHVGAYSMQGTDGCAYRDIADLQVLDYICGNPNRSKEKLGYQFVNKGDAELPYLAGIQGLDNEGSFGLLVPEEGRQVGSLPALENLRAVSRSTYERVMALDKATLKYALRGFGLSEKELDAAGQRLTQLQNALKKGVEYYAGVDELYDNAPIEVPDKPDEKDAPEDSFSFSNDTIYIDPVTQKENTALTLEPGRIRIVQDDEFYRINRENVSVLVDKSTGKQANLSGKGAEDAENLVSGNTFYEACQGILEIPTRIEHNKYQELQANSALQAGAGNRCIPAQLRENSRAVNLLSLQLDQSTKTFHSSGKYRDLQRAAAAYAKYSRKLSLRIETANDPRLRDLPDYKRDLEAILRPKELKKLQELGAKLEKAAQKYLDGKFKNGKTADDYSDYTKRRIENAQMALTLGKKNAVIRPEEEDAAKVNERQAKENLARRLGDRAEALYNRKHPTGKPVDPIQEEPRQIIKI